MKRPDQGALLGPDVLGVPAVVAGFPFLREGRVVDFMAEAGEWYRAYAERWRRSRPPTTRRSWRRRAATPCPILMAHFMVGGVHDRPRGAARRARAAHGRRLCRHRPGDPRRARSTSRWATSTRRRRCPARPVPAHYAGSLLALDFGEAGEQKRVVIVDAEPGRLATVESIPLTSGRRADPRHRRLGRDRGPRSASSPRRSSTSRCGPPAPTSPSPTARARRSPILVKVRALAPRGRAQPSDVAKGGRSMGRALRRLLRTRARRTSARGPARAVPRGARGAADASA